jgi:hypothetical protein
MTALAQQADHCVSQDGVPQMADVRSFIGIDTGVFYNHLFVLRESSAPLTRWLGLQSVPKCGAIKEGIEIPTSRHLNARDAFQFGQAAGNLLRNHARGFLQALRQFETDRGRGLSHFELGRLLQYNGNFDAIGFLDKRGNRVAKPIPNR